MSISKQLVELMGGRIGLESQPGKGSIFWFELTLDQVIEKDRSKRTAEQVVADKAGFTGSSAETDHAPQNFQIQARVLLAEDNLVNQEVAIEMLNNLGCEVRLAQNGAEALSALSNNGFDVVFMDCQMPLLDGFEATRTYRRMEHQNGPELHVPIIALTANAVKGIREQCLAAGMDDYLSKPYKQQDISNMLRKWLPEEKTVSCSENVLIHHTSDMTVKAPDNTDPIDHVYIDMLRTLQRPGRDNILNKVIGLYLLSTPGLLEQMQSAIVADDARGLQEVAHSLKSSSANLGATKLASYFKQLEQTGAGGTASCDEGMLQEIDHEFLRVKFALEALVEAETETA
jgi:CheY-like chemotaxis protein/HPt (histidine-containing phosphotransfer) domain-containing protein